MCRSNFLFVIWQLSISLLESGWTSVFHTTFRWQIKCELRQFLCNWSFHFIFTLLYMFLFSFAFVPSRHQLFSRLLSIICMAMQIAEAFHLIDGNCIVVADCTQCVRIYTILWQLMYLLFFFFNSDVCILILYLF